MRELFEANALILSELERRANGACVVYHDLELPPGCVPPRSDVGVEVDQASGETSLLVRKGVHYSGGDDLVSRWLTAGELSFASFSDLVLTLQGPLAEQYRGPARVAEQGRRCADGTRLRSAEVLTDLDAVDVPRADSVQFLDAADLVIELERVVIGQHAASVTTAAAVRRHAARVRPERPLSLYFVGETGVGKTSMAERLASVLEHFGDSSWRYLRIDMSEYQESYRVSQLLGAPQGYTGYGEGSELLRVLAANPRTVVLFDEIDKAHPTVLTALMNVLGSGRLSSPERAAGTHQVDCRRAIFVFTSNQEGAEIAAEVMRRGVLGDPEKVDEICRRHLRARGVAAEILGRVSAFAVFHPLDESACARILTKSVARCATAYGVDVAWVDPALVRRLLGEASTREFGVRPVEALVDRVLADAFIEAARATPYQIVEIVEGSPPFCRVLPLDLDDRLGPAEEGTNPTTGDPSAWTDSDDPEENT